MVNWSFLLCRKVSITQGLITGDVDLRIQHDMEIVVVGDILCVCCQQR
jgi:hypothetical protein